MFVDNPVGTGYSYVEDYSLLTTDNAMIASDLVAVVKAAFAAHPQMQVMPFYVFAESYGGKMTVDFALEFEEVGMIFSNGMEKASVILFETAVEALVEESEAVLCYSFILYMTPDPVSGHQERRGGKRFPRRGPR